MKRTVKNLQEALSAEYAVVTVGRLKDFWRLPERKVSEIFYELLIDFSVTQLPLKSLGFDHLLMFKELWKSGPSLLQKN